MDRRVGPCDCAAAEALKTADENGPTAQPDNDNLMRIPQGVVVRRWQSLAKLLKSRI